VRAIATSTSLSADSRPAGHASELGAAGGGFGRFPLARRHGYTGVSSKTCKGLYKSILNAARCRLWNREEGAERYFMSAEDLTTQAGLAVQQDLALAALLGIRHVERNGHHYTNGMAGALVAEQEEFLKAHPDLYEVSDGKPRLRIRGGRLNLESLDCKAFGSAVVPDLSTSATMTPAEWPPAGAPAPAFAHSMPSSL